MSKPIIEIQGIGKRYRIGAAKEPYLSLRAEVAKWLSPAARRARAAEEDFWALRDVSFSVEPGEAVGIIGRNGAGKSTLLKILSQITPPTEGKITCRGRIASLLEVGTGFHPELTGRENIYMNGAILGMSRKEIARKFDEIVAFAEMEKFLDTPVKRYSSGMYVRLAFAVAAHLEPEILVVDEVLAVGDTEFQKKCIGKMGSVARSGRTVLFVSHNMAAVSSLCPSCVTLEIGKMIACGRTGDCIDEYLKRGAVEKQFTRRAGNTNGKSHIRSCHVLDSRDKIVESVQCGDEITFSIECFASDAYASYAAAIDLYNDRGIRVFYCNSMIVEGKSFASLYGKSFLRCHIPRLPLMPGTYLAHVSLTQNNERVDLVENAFAFDVVEGDFWKNGRFVAGPNPPLVLVDQYWTACTA
jgi:lipopolysaccharide transport system ATP-binding protein